MNSHYEENRQKLSRISIKYGCKGDIVMRTSIQYVLQYGQEMFKNEKWVEEQLKLIEEKHLRAEEEGKTLWITKDFEMALINCAKEIAQIDTYDLIIYMQKEMFWSNEGGIDYNRLKDIAESIMDWIVCDSSDSSEDYNTFSNYCHIDDGELKELGFEYLIPNDDDGDFEE